MFEGHEFIKIKQDEWVFDLTDYRGYKVDLDKYGNIVRYTLAFEVLQTTVDINIEKFISVPFGILKEVKKIIEGHRKRLCLDK